MGIGFSPRPRRARWPKLVVILVALVVVSITLSGAAADASPPAAVAPVPAKYESEYAQTASDLQAYARAIDAMPSYSNQAASAKVGFAELLDANGNRMTALLKPSTMTHVNQSLDAFKRLGVGGVVLGIKLPLLLSQYTSQAGQYTQFWLKVANAARARGFVIDVELGALFCGTIYAHCSYKYPTTAAGWAKLTAQQARTVIDKVRPNYLDLISEPNTEAILTGIQSLQTVSGFQSFVSDTVKTIGHHGTTKLIAGAASWFPATYDQAIVGSGINGLVTHIYPATAGTAANLAATSRVAHDAHLPLIADETWLYKGTTSAAGAVQDVNGQGAQNCYSFWEPLDVEFIRSTREWAAKTGSPVVSGFWSWQTFAYSMWTPTLDAESAPQIQAQNYASAQEALSARTFTETGFALVGRAGA